MQSNHISQEMLFLNSRFHFDITVTRVVYYFWARKIQTEPGAKTQGQRDWVFALDFGLFSIDFAGARSNNNSSVCFLNRFRRVIADAIIVPSLSLKGGEEYEIGSQRLYSYLPARRICYRMALGRSSVMSLFPLFFGAVAMLVSRTATDPLSLVSETICITSRAISLSWVFIRDLCRYGDRGGGVRRIRTFKSNHFRPIFFSLPICLMSTILS